MNGVNTKIDEKYKNTDAKVIFGVVYFWSTLIASF